MIARKAAIEADESIERLKRQQELFELEHKTGLTAAKLKFEIEEESCRVKAEIENHRAKVAHTADVDLTRTMAEIECQELKIALKEKKYQTEIAFKTDELQIEKLADDQRIIYMDQSSAIERNTLAAQAEAQKTVLESINPHLTAELKRVADTNENFRIADTLAKNLAPTSLIAGKSMADILVELSRGTVYQDIFKGFTGENANKEK